MRQFFLFITCVLYIQTANAQKVELVSSSTGDPIPSVAVFNTVKLKSTISDESGIADLTQFNSSDTLFFQHSSFILLKLPYEIAISKKVIKLERKNVLIPEFIISATKHRETQHDIAGMVDVVGSKKLSYLPVLNSADLLTNTGNIFVQKSQAGGGSPVLRGFEANKVLLIVDGIRMNNAIFRSGHLQNSLTIDNAILDRAEIVYGPSSVIYGSDALGGVIHYITKEPILSDTNIVMAQAGAYTQYASATNTNKNHVHFNIGGKSFASLTSFTLSRFGNIKMGNRRDPFYGDWGKQKWYVERIDNTDSVVVNPNPEIIKLASYNQIDVLQKFRYSPDQSSDHTLNIQYSNSSNINRHDQLNNLKDDYPEFAEWYYGPQKRFLASTQSLFKATEGIFSNFVVTLGYQNIEESRFTRNFNADTLFKQIEGVQVFSGNFDFMKFLDGKNKFNYGVEVNHNLVSSGATKENIISGVELPTLSRYPDAGANTWSFAAYGLYKRYLHSKLIASLGVRTQYYALNSAYGDMYYELPEIFKDISLENKSLTGHVSLIYHHNRSTKINFVLSNGFRSPNLDDLAKIRLTSGKLTLPNPDLVPEQSYNAELGILKTFDGYIQINANYFVDYLTNVIVRDSFAFPDGANTLWFQGEPKETYVNVNSSEGIIHGFSMNMISDLNSDISFKGTLNYTYGRDLSEDLPLAHIPPIFGRANFSYETKSLTAEIYFIYTGWKRIEDMVLTSEDKRDEATEHGFPGWYTSNITASYKFTDQIIFQLAVENVTNNFYQAFASGVPAPGINFIGTLRLDFK